MQATMQLVPIGAAVGVCPPITSLMNCPIIAFVKGHRRAACQECALFPRRMATAFLFPPRVVGGHPNPIRGLAAIGHLRPVLIVIRSMRVT